MRIHLCFHPLEFQEMQSLSWGRTGRFRRIAAHNSLRYPQSRASRFWPLCLYAFSRHAVQSSLCLNPVDYFGNNPGRWISGAIPAIWPGRTLGPRRFETVQSFTELVIPPRNRIGRQDWTYQECKQQGCPEAPSNCLTGAIDSIWPLLYFRPWKTDRSAMLAERRAASAILRWASSWPALADTCSSIR